jgi:hypothetical protein
VKTIEQLYLDRCYLTDEGKPVPHFWSPNPIKKVSYTLYGDDTSPVLEEWGVSPVIEKVLALGLRLEIPVGEFVNAAAKKDLPDDPFVKRLLTSNVSDEARHYEGFNSACRNYGVGSRFIQEAQEIEARWKEAVSTCHPLEVAQVLEVGIFLVTLGILRIAGGKELATMAARISEDESRHTVSNRTVLYMMGIDPTNPPKRLRSLTYETLDWVLDGLDISEEDVGEQFNKDFCIRASDELIETGRAVDYDSVIFLSDHFLPFECRNIDLYSRSY